MGVSQPNWKKYIEVCEVPAPTSTEILSSLRKKKKKKKITLLIANIFSLMDSIQTKNNNNLKKKTSLVHSGNLSAHQSQSIMTLIYVIELIKCLQSLQEVHFYRTYK